MLSTKQAPMQNQTDLPKLYLESATVPGKTNIFFIGPFGKRVSFASQQRRAFNVVWAVGQQRLLASNPSVAVVGGGLAGITTCAALVAQKCRVTLIEARDSVLERQIATNHRYVHPTVNFWPEKEISGTTSFPYLDWYEARCSTVIETIKFEWKEHFEKSISRFLPRTKVSKIENSDTKVKLTFQTNFGHPDEGMAEGMFDMVFVTSGFGDEASLVSGDRSYWDRDGLEEARDAGSKDFVIAGTGDGGLIEALRLVQKQFNNGNLCLDVIGDLDDLGLSGRVKMLEHEAFAKFRKDDVEAAKFYASAYKELIDDIPLRAKDRLSERFSGIRVRLVGTLPAPFGLWVAPIHKLMMAAAIEAGAVEYNIGKVQSDGAGYAIVAADGSKAPIENTARVVVRIGPSHPLGSFLDASAITMLKEAQQATADILDVAEIDTDFFGAFSKHPKRDVEEYEFVRFRKALADRYFYDHFKIKSTLSVDHPPRYIVPLKSSEDNYDGTLPDKIFGIAVEGERIRLGAQI